MLFISTLHIGTDVYIVEFKFSSEQKMLVESLGPALTQERKDVYWARGKAPSSISQHSKTPQWGSTSIFSSCFPFSFFLLHFFDHCCLVLLCAVWCCAALCCARSLTSPSRSCLSLGPSPACPRTAALREVHGLPEQTGSPFQETWSSSSVLCFPMKLGSF